MGKENIYILELDPVTSMRILPVSVWEERPLQAQCDLDRAQGKPGESFAGCDGLLKVNVPYLESSMICPT